MNSKKVIVSHLFNASPKDLWDAWTDPNQYAEWFNPAPGLNLIIYEFDVRVGGHYKFDMPRPNGDPNTQEGIFYVLNPYKELMLGSIDKPFLIIPLFEKEEDKTKMVVEITGVHPEYQTGAPQVWNAIFIKLQGYLQKFYVVK